MSRLKLIAAALLLVIFDFYTASADSRAVVLTDESAQPPAVVASESGSVEPSVD